MQRTYSRKGRRHSRNVETISSPSLERDTPSPRPRKRRKIEVEVVLGSPGSNLDDNDEESVRLDVGESVTRSASLETRGKNDIRVSHKAPKPPFKPKSSSKPNSSRNSRPTSSRGSPTLSIASSSRSQLPLETPFKLSHFSDAKPSVSQDKGVKDLSDLFDFSRPTKDTSEKPVKGHYGVAKRMLRRTRTESSTSDASIGSATVEGPLLSGSSTPRKLTARRTESIIDLTYDSQSASGSQPLTLSKSKSLDDVSSQSPKRPPLVSTASVRTYGGNSRSFLVALPRSHSHTLSQYAAGSQSQPLPEQNDISMDDTQEDDFEIHESYTELRARWGVDNSEDDPYPDISPEGSPAGEGKGKGKGKQSHVPIPHLPSGMMNDLKSISELRSKGESRRFLDDMGYLFEGLDPNGAISVRRGSALEIVTKLCNTDFARKAKAADFFGRAWEGLREAGAGDGDKVLDTIIVLFAALVSRDPRDLEELASKSDFTFVLYRLLGTLERSNDPLWLISCGFSDIELKRAGVPKVDKAILAGLHQMIRKKSALYDESAIISNRLLISTALTALMPSLHSPSNISTLLSTLLDELHPLPSRISAYASGLSFLPPVSSSSHLDTLSFLHVDNCLRLLDSYLLGRWNAGDDSSGLDLRQSGSQQQIALSTALSSLCVAVDIISLDNELRQYRSIGNKCMESVFRVLINLTHDNISWCRSILKEQATLPTIMRIIVMSHRQRLITIVKQEPDTGDIEIDEDGDAAQLLDRLCLALGLLTNLIQVDDDAKELLRDTLVDSRCLGRRGCIMGCRCPSRVSALECLASVYLEHCKSDDALEVVVRGHIAVLFGLLMRRSRENQKILLAALPGTSDKKKLSSLADNAREFTLFYVEFAKKLSSSSLARDEGDGDEDEDGDRREESMGRVLHDTQGEMVARNVIAFLEDLQKRAHD